MNDDILKELLSDVLKEQLLMKKEQLSINNQLTKIALLLSEDSKSEVNNQVSIDESNGKFLENMDSCIEKVNQLLLNIPTEIKSSVHHEQNLVLFSKKYDEGEYGFKQLLNGFYLFLLGCLIVFCSFKYLPLMFKKKENKAYEQTFYWYYLKSNPENKKALKETFSRFHQGDTTYLNELNKLFTQKKQ